MAISKQQPMRSAEIELIEASNAHTLSLDALSDNLARETDARELADTNLQQQIGEGFSSELSVAQSLGATNRTIGDGFDTQNTITDFANALNEFLGTRTDLDDTVVNSILTLADSTEALGAFVSRFKIGCIDNVTIPANDSVSTSATFDEPFAANDTCVLFAQVVTNELASLFTYTLIDCTYSGFSYSIANSDANAHTVSLGYVAVKVN